MKVGAFIHFIFEFSSSSFPNHVDDDADEEEREAYEDQINRLRVADQLTQGMTKEEYMHYSDCRQASFTYKKLKRFREWCEMGKVTILIEFLQSLTVMDKYAVLRCKRKQRYH